MKYFSEIRKRKGLTQFDLSEITGVALNSIARYERCEVQPSVEVALKIANALNVTVDELMNGPILDNSQ